MSSIWDVKAHEKAEEQAFERVIDQLERAINLGKRALAVRNAPGFQDLMKAIEDLRKGHVNQLCSTSSKLSDTEIRELRGRVHGIADILALLGKSENAIEHLAARKALAENQLSEVRKRRPQTKPDEVSS